MYITAFSVFLLLLVYLPLAIWGLYKLWPRLPARLSIRVPATILLALVLAAIPLWDVTLTTAKMAELCPQAGLHVKRSVKVDGYYSNIGGRDTLDRAFNYIETRSYGDDITVYRRAGDVVKEEKFNAKQYQIKSQYEYILGLESGAYQGRRDIGVSRSVVRDRRTGEELGYRLRYSAYPGWVDRNTIALLGQVLWACPDFTQDLIVEDKVLLPNSTHADKK